MKERGGRRPVMKPAENALQGVQGLILDLDGVIYRGNELLPGAVEFVAFLARSGRRVVALTNHAGASAAVYSDKLRRLGVDLPASHIVTSAWAAAHFLQGCDPRARVWVLGSPALRAALLDAGLNPVGEDGEPDYVVVGFDAGLDFARLSRATRHLLRGAELVGCNPDALLPTPGGPLPECGPVLAFLEIASGQKATVVGKPNPWIFRQALIRLEVAADEALMVGDTLATDIAGGRAAGLRTALLLTGNTREPAAEATVTARDLPTLQAMLEAAPLSR